MRLEATSRTSGQTTSPRTICDTHRSPLLDAGAASTNCALPFARRHIGLRQELAGRHVFDRAPSKATTYPQLEGASGGIRNRSDRGHLDHCARLMTNTFCV
jgi:hypothetical protein